MGTKARAIDRAERLEVKDRAVWRAWLSANHAQKDGVCLVVYKKHHRHYLPWGDIVREALCFGWIDSVVRRLDDDRTLRYVTPRKSGSIWSAVNKKHIAELTAAGLMHPSGQAAVDAAKRDGSWTLLDDIDALIVPADLAAHLDSTPGARAKYEGFTVGSKKALLWWIKSAKTAATRAKRIARTAEQAALGNVAIG